MAIPIVLANFSTTLASGIGSTASSLTLSRSTDDDGSTLSGVFYLTVDEGTASEEHMIVTLVGSAGTISTRGVSRVDGVTSKTANKFAHSRGASVKITNLALLRVIRRLNGAEAFDSVDLTGVNSISGLATPTSGETTKACNIAYANALAIAGAPDATESVKGIVELATYAEALAGTDTGSTGASLVVKPSYLAKLIQNSGWNYGVDAGAVDDYAITLTPAPTAYATGQGFVVKVNTANTGAATLNVNGLGVKAIKKNHDQDLEDGDVEAASYISVIYDGTNFELVGQQATMPTTAILSEMSLFFGATDITGAEAETLTNGSNADLLHSHPMFMGVGARLPKTYLNFNLPYDDISTGLNIWVISACTTTTLTKTASVTSIPIGDNPNYLISANIFQFTSGGAALMFNSGKDVFAEFAHRRGGTGSEQMGFGLTSGAAVLSDYDDQTVDAACFTVDAAGALYGHTSSAGVGHTETPITGVTLTNWNVFRIEFNGGTDVKFYVNGVLKATNNTNLPAGATAIKIGYGGSGNTGNNGDYTSTVPSFAVEI